MSSLPAPLNRPARSSRALREWAGRLVRPTGPLPPLSWRGQLFDVLLALGLFAVALIAGGDDVEVPVRLPPPGQDLPGLPIREPFPPVDQDQAVYALMLVVVLPLVLRRRYPLGVLWAVVVMAPFVVEQEAALRLSFYSCVIAGYTAAVYSPHRLPALASLPAAAAVYAEIREPAIPTVPDGAVPFLILVPIAFAAGGLRRWKLRADEGRARLSTLEREQATAVRRAAEQERARIARELHDVVTHHVSVMVIQAGAARTVMNSDPTQAREALVAVESTGRAAMSELRHVMGLLTLDDGAETADGLTPQPGLDQVEELVQRVRDTGTPVELAVVGQRRPLPPGIELTAFRVVQEALTNTVKHAPGAGAEVHIAYRDRQLLVDVIDSGTPRAPAVQPPTGGGHGLMGLRERLAVYGGTLHARPRLTGAGFRVAAEIPLDAP